MHNKSPRDAAPLSQQGTIAPSEPEQRQQDAPNQRADEDAPEIQVVVEHVVRRRKDTLLPLRFVSDQLKLAFDSSELYADLLLFIPFLILFIFFFLAGRDVESNFYVVAGFRDRMFNLEYPTFDAQLQTLKTQVESGQRIWVELDKNYAGIGNNGDWPVWYQQVMTNALWDCNNPDRTYEMNAPLGQNFLLGALRVRTQQVRSDSCGLRSEFYPTNNNSQVSQNCYDALSSGTEITDPYMCNFTNPITGDRLFGYRKCADVPGAPTSAVEGIYHCGGYMYEVPFNTSCNVAQQFATMVADTNCDFTNQWSTRFIMTEFFMYTPSTDTFHSMKFYSEVMNPGWWYNQWYTRSFTVWSTDQGVQTAVDVFLFVYVLYYWLLYFYELGVHVCRRDQTVVSYIFDFWNLLDLTVLVTFLAAFVFRFSWYVVSSDAGDTLRLPMAAQYPPYLDKLQVLYEGVVYCNSILTVLVFLKVLKYVRLNPRLNVLTRTIAEAQQSLFGVIILFFTIVTGYAITGWNLFGMNVERYRNLGVSFSSQLRQLAGDIDYDSIRQENRFLAGFFFWSFTILCAFLLLNFIVAIISDSFAKVSGKAVETPIDETVARWWQTAKAVLKPSNLQRMIVNYFTGKSEAKLLRQVVEQLNDQYQVRFDAAWHEKHARRRAVAQAEGAAGVMEDMEEDDDDDDLKILISFDDLAAIIEPTLYADLSHHFWTYTWADLMNEFDDATKASEEVSKRQMAETVQLSVEKILGDDLNKISQLDDALRSLEDEVSRILVAAPVT